MTTPTETTKCLNPITGELLYEMSLTDINEFKGIVENARIAQEKWAKFKVNDRIVYMKKIREFIIDNSDSIARTISQDNGKNIIDSLATEVIPAAMAVSYYSKNAKKFLKTEKALGGNIAFINKRSKIERVPYGVVGIISPWNYPFAIPFSEIIMGLLAGNSVILKVASETQYVGKILKECIEYAKLPTGVFNHVNIPGRIAGDLFLESGIDKLFFTGSVAIGKVLMKKASETLTPVCLELGGNDPMIVLDDADLDRAVGGAIWAGFQNSGQSCGGVERIYVHEKIYDKFLIKLKERVERLRIGESLSFDYDVGGMTTQNQIKIVNEHIDSALKEGAKLYAQSKGGEDNLLPAKVIIDVNHNMDLMKHETFGPVVGIMKFSSDNEAIELANDSYLGLTASVWSTNNRKADVIAKKIKAGVVTINDHLMSHGLAETSWGGFKQSGIGRTHGKLGFDEMTQPQFIIKDLFGNLPKNLWWHPYSEKLYNGLSGLLQFLYGKNFGAKISGLKNLMKIVPRMLERK
ncbi:MAG: aldehyde dehydrogenase family protein [Melioribacteraceae bacterium]|nr:aldehyde dehydrogenase family protein [Melioribacteraceae bacterium]